MSSIGNALRTGGKRAKVHDAQAVFKLPATAKALVAKIAEKESMSEGAIHREALAEYFERRGYRA